MAKRRGRLCVRCRGLPRYRCRLRSAGCGFSTAWRERARPTTFRWRCGSRGRSTMRRWKRRWAMLWSATRSPRTVFARRRVARQLILDGEAGRPHLHRSSVSEAELAGALSAAAGRGFDLAVEPPLRAHLFALGISGTRVLLLLLHPSPVRRSRPRQSSLQSVQADYGRRRGLRDRVCAASGCQTAGAVAVLQQKRYCRRESRPRGDRANLVEERYVQKECPHLKPLPLPCPVESIPPPWLPC